MVTKSFKQNKVSRTLYKRQRCRNVKSRLHNY